MANAIKPKRTSTTSKVPTISDLADGEMGVNAVDGKTYIRVGSTIYLIGEKNDPSSGTDLSIGANNSTTLRIDSSTGTNVTLSGATTSLAGLMVAADKTKLNGVATNATVGANWSTNLTGIPANISSWAGISPTSKQDSGYLTGSSNAIRLHSSSGDSSGGAIWITSTPTLSFRVDGSQVWGVTAAGNVVANGTLSVVGEATVGGLTVPNGYSAISLGDGGASIGGASTGSAVLAGNGNAIALRPNGNASTTGQLIVTATGDVSISGDLSVGGSISGYMPTSWQVIAGNGLTGGGTGAANRTLTLATPGTLTGSTTNAVTASSHTHALSLDSRDVPMFASTVNANTTLSAAHLNTVVEKTTSTDYTYTLPPGLGTRGDVITIVNSSGGVITIARGSGVGLYRNGTNADIAVTTGSMVTMYKANAADRWIAS